ncbi:hypothetical protein EYF80_058620 [Liparis tanakae]|uniref:Uncharacterized protein n=1 Tax=Liparis tanakae TaxID=230148 RepID=A0A4Z2EQV7_9TELE|nr:hypothetical protein EYF80_058620 [Liparis tanakae]
MKTQEKLLLRRGASCRRRRLSERRAAATVNSGLMECGEDTSERRRSGWRCVQVCGKDTRNPRRKE